MKNIKLIKPIFAPKPWGNNPAIIDFLGYDPGFTNTIGEIFLASGLPSNQGGSTSIENKTIYELFADETKRIELFGKDFLNTNEFPFLFKILAVNEPLSLQVHPEDQLLGNTRIPGKTEGWWAVTNAKVLCGFKKGFSKADFQNMIKNKYFEKKHTIDDLANFMNIIELNKGEAIYVESGTIHTILEGVLLEPQQPCNITFRIYDWGRTMPDRPLQLTKALEALNYAARPQKFLGTGVFFNNPNFKVEKLTSSTEKILNQDYFHLVLPIGNKITINEFEIPQGQCAFIPANTKKINLSIGDNTNVFLANAQ